MPNHITNLITFGTDSDSLAAFQQMLRDMRAEDQPLGSFDFNKLIPMPKSLNIEEGTRTEQGLKLYQEFMRERAAIIKSDMSPARKENALAVLDRTWRPRRMDDPDTWSLGEKAYDNLQKYGHTSWYSWCIQNWGTKWNSYQSSPLQDGDDTMRFLTAWAAVPNLIKKLSEKYPEQTITYCWADEEVGYNVGEIVLRGGDIIEDHTPVSGSREAYEMASEIMGIDLADFNLYLSKDKTGYEYRDEPPVETKPQPAKKSRRKDVAR